MNGEKNLLAMTLSLILMVGTADAAEIYQWVDEEGVTHFSDTPPDNGTAAESLHVNSTNPPGYDPETDPYSIANQAKRMNEKWSELAEEKERRAERRREEAARRPPPYYYSQRYDGWRYSHWPGYYAPSQPAQPPANQFRTVRRQATALETLELTGPRPYSINSSAHHARVQSSSNFLQSVSRPAPRPTPRGN